MLPSITLSSLVLYQKRCSTLPKVLKQRQDDSPTLMDSASVRGRSLIRNCRAPVMERMMKIQPSMKMAAMASLYLTLPVPSASAFLINPQGFAYTDWAWKAANLVYIERGRGQ